jgi:hypothetical protein
MYLNKFRVILIAAAAFTCVETAQASTMTVSIRPIASLANSSGQDYVDNWNGCTNSKSHTGHSHALQSKATGAGQWLRVSAAQSDRAML